MKRLCGCSVCFVLMVLSLTYINGHGAQDVKQKAWKVTICMFLGRDDNPEFLLNSSEIKIVKQMLKGFSEKKAKIKDFGEAYPVLSSYSGIEIEELNKGDAINGTRIHLLGKYLWEQGKRSKDDVMELESDALEEYLIKLASDKGAIDSNLMKALRDAKKRNDDYRKLSYGK